MIPSIRENPSHWNTAELGSHTLPGFCSISGAAGVSLDVQKAKGQDKATIKDNGADVAKLRLEWRFLGEHWTEAQRIVADLNPTKQGAKRAPVGLSHARTDLLGINRVYVQEISTPEVDKEIYTIKMQLLQWVPAPKKAKASKVPKESVERTNDGPGTFVNLLHEPVYDGVFYKDADGNRLQEDQDLIDFMQNAI